MVPLGINEMLTPPSLPNSINIYIDPRGTLFGAALLCFTLPALLVKSVIDHYASICVGCVTGICYRIGLVQKELLLHSTPQCTHEYLIAYYSFTFTIPCTQTDQVCNQRREKFDLAGELTGCLGRLLGPLQVSMFILYLDVQA